MMELYGLRLTAMGVPLVEICTDVQSDGFVTAGHLFAYLFLNPVQILLLVFLSSLAASIAIIYA
jgi:hypothetical protein